ncbi:hypothetical protein [Hydrogenophaga sp. 2FB]|uniref:hypothetical protein n=1 Tax=Hydrogenophaga sp. 2FB TaxID=2502187 RepID=UPI0010F5F326|nr:hypothetical protein [Hydrogenophaga sp. 2FB]
MPQVRIALRVALAVFGGYALACAVAIALPPLLPLPRAQAVLAATLLGFVVHVVAALWCFAQPDLRRVAVGLLLPATLLAGVGLLLAKVLP